MRKEHKLFILNDNLYGQRGQTLIVLLVLLVLGSAAAFYTFVSPTSSAIERDKVTAAALAQAKTALIGYAASHSTRPGTFPCPDLATNTPPNNTPNDGVADIYDSGDCPNYVAGSNVYLGRLPWKTLGLPDLRDADGERLWYAVSRDFARNPTCLPNCPLTSDTFGQLDITGTSPSNNVVAIIFSPGASFGTQNRNSSGENTASNYLDGSNASGNSTFTTAASSSTFNDRLLVIEGSDLFPILEQRVAREIIAILNAYKAATSTSTLYLGGVYPWADLADGDSNGDIFSSYNRNRFPCFNALPVNWGATPPLGTAPTPTLPLWLQNGCWDRGWTSLIYYSVARNRLDLLSLGLLCTTCSGATLTITNPTNKVGTQCTNTSPPACSTQIIATGNADLVLITPGAVKTIDRSPGWPLNWSQINFYFEDFENRDNNDDTFTVPTSTNYDRDRVYVVR